MSSIVFLGLMPQDQAKAASYSNQNVTAYTAASGAKTYHGTTPTLYRTAAVHPRTCGSPSSGTKLAYGTQIYTDQELYLPGFINGYKDDFLVEDMGDVNCNRGLSTYWFDIYFGVSNNLSKSYAQQFGKKSGVSYTTY